MSEVILFVLLGLGTGALISALALGIVLSYRGSGAINVAIGAVAMLGAYVFYDLRTSGALLLPPIPFAPSTISLGSPWSTGPAMVVAIAICGVTGVLFDAIVGRRLRGATPLAKVLASLGLMVTLQSIAILRFGSTGQTAPPVFSERPADSVTIFGQSVPTDRFILAGLMVVVAAALWALYRYTSFGLATRAAAENETKAMLAGLPPNRLSLLNNVLGFSLAGALGVLVAPLTQLDPTTLALLVVPALAAALFARFTSFGIAVGVGMLMGIIESLVTYLSSEPWFPTSAGIALPGVTELVFFLLVVIAMLLRGAKLPQRGSLTEGRLPPAPRAKRILVPSLLSAAVAACALLLFSYNFRQAEINSMIGAIVCLSFVVTTGFAGQISIVQLGIAGISAFIVSKLAVHAGIGFPIGPLIATLAATASGLVMAIPALRVRGVNLAIVTLAAALALQQFVFANPTIGGSTTGSPVPPPHLFGIDLSTQAKFPINAAVPPSPVFGFVCVAAVVLLGMLVASLRRSELGQRMLAVRSNERAAAAAGVDVRSTKLLAFGFASAIAGVAGTLYAYDFGTVTASQFDVLTGLLFVAFAYLGGITSVAGAVVGGVLATDGLGIHAINAWFGVPVAYQALVGGLALIVTIVMNPLGIAGALAVSWKARRPSAPTGPSTSSSPNVRCPDPAKLVG
jgi:branched-chain amino acid transport system permease protein